MRKNYRKRKFNRKRKSTYKVFFLVVVAMTLGFAAINTTLQLIGTLNISRTTWNIHFENATKTGGVNATTEVKLKDGDNTTVEYQVNLKNPGEYYEFTVDAKNDGTIDAMVTGISNKVYENSVEITKPDYLDFIVSYGDGTAIENNHLLASTKSETYKVKVMYKDNLTADQLPTSTKSLKFTFSVTYMQADENAESTIIFDNQNATTPGTTTTKVKYNQSLQNITVPTKTGSTFKGYADTQNAYELNTSVYNLPSSDRDKRIGFYEKGRYQPTNNNGWALITNGDKNTHINGRFRTTSNITALDFNDILLDESMYTITEFNGEYTVYVDFDVTEAMVSKRTYNYDTDYRFIDVTLESNSQVTVDYMIRNSKKYYDSTGNGLINYDLLTNTKLYAMWQ